MGERLLPGCSRSGQSQVGHFSLLCRLPDQALNFPRAGCLHSLEAQCSSCLTQSTQGDIWTVLADKGFHGSPGLGVGGCLLERPGAVSGKEKVVSERKAEGGVNRVCCALASPHHAFFSLTMPALRIRKHPLSCFTKAWLPTVPGR